MKSRHQDCLPLYQSKLLVTALSCLILISGCTEVFTTSVDSEQEINQIQGNFNGLLDDNDLFGSSIANLGDLDGDGITDLVVGSSLDDDGGTDQGAVWILFMDNKGEVTTERKISSSEGSFAGSLAVDDRFGSSVENIGDLNNDGVVDLAVGAPGDDEGGLDRGAVWILFMNNNGTVLSEQKIANGLHGFPDALNDGDGFGTAIANIGDLNNDGVNDLAVGTPLHDDGGQDVGAIWILFLNTGGSVINSQMISFSNGGFAGDLFANDRFGLLLALVDDVNNDGVTDLLVGTPGDDDGGTNRGAVWLLFMNTNGTVNDELKISQTQGKFDGEIGDGAEFGSGVALLGDYNGDGISEIGVAAKFSNDGGVDRGAFWVIFPEDNGEVLSSSKISDIAGRFGGVLADSDHFATDLTGIGDLDGDGVNDIAVTASGDDGNGINRGATWILFMAPTETEIEFDDEADLGTIFGGS